MHLPSQNRLMRMGFNSYIQKVSLQNGQTWYRIKVGSFSTRKEAEAIQDELKQKVPHIKSYIMRKRVPSKTAVAGEVAENTKELAIINPAVSAHRKKTPSHEKPEVVEIRPTRARKLLQEKRTFLLRKPLQSKQNKPPRKWMMFPTY